MRIHSSIAIFFMQNEKIFISFENSYETEFLKYTKTLKKAYKTYAVFMFSMRLLSVFDF